MSAAHWMCIYVWDESLHEGIIPFSVDNTRHIQHRLHTLWKVGVKTRLDGKGKGRGSCVRECIFPNNLKRLLFRHHLQVKYCMESWGVAGRQQWREIGGKRTSLLYLCYSCISSPLSFSSFWISPILLPSTYRDDLIKQPDIYICITRGGCCDRRGCQNVKGEGD